jgi:hypothetical protein
MTQTHVMGSRGDGEVGERWIRTSMTRIWDSAGPGDLSAAPLPRGEWTMGDYVLTEVLGDPRGRFVEVVGGRLLELSAGDLLIGALGNRFATLEATGSWQDVGGDGRMDLLSAGGIVGRCRSLSTLVPEMARLGYRGHVSASGRNLRMSDCVTPQPGAPQFRTPLVLITGTSMSAGKTTAAKVLIRRLRRMGLTVLGAKLAGAGRYRDIQAMGDAGADQILDFVDAGLPSTNCGEDEYRRALGTLLGRMAAADVDIAVVEIGASPLEPYNGDLAIEAIRDVMALNILCASDPYAVAGALQAYDLVPDLVTGTTSNTEAGVQLVERLTGLKALDVRKPSSFPELDRILKDRFKAG